MTINEELDLAEKEFQEVPEVNVRGGEAVIRINLTNAVEERKVKLPKTVWG
jgi:hypothetical protein